MPLKQKWRKRTLYLAAFAGSLALCYFFLMPVVNGMAGIYNRNHHNTIVRSKQGKAPRNYFIRPGGNDDNNGRTIATAWKSIARLNDVEFNPGDSILLEGGQHFAGNVLLHENDLGTKESPIYFGSYGFGRAMIVANTGSAIRATDAEGLHFSKLILKGSGAAGNSGNGLAIVNNLRGDVRLHTIRIDSLEVFGFGYIGILVEGRKTKSGFSNVSIENCSVHDNGDAGLYVRGNPYPWVSGYAHANVTIRKVFAFNNPGRPASKMNTGSGIVVSDTDTALVESCVAYGNGALCTSKQGGPVGIWAWHAREVVIQYSESYSNKTGGFYDGGGFDLDGGCVNCVLQYNYSHDNDGSGFFLAQFYWAPKHTGNVIRYNVSQNDGRKNGYAGLDVWGEVEDGYLYNNTVLLRAAPSDTCSAVLFRPNFEMGWNKMRFPKRVVVANNVFVVTGNVDLVRAKFGVEDVTLMNNNYFSTTDTCYFNWNGKRYSSLEAWGLATKQERKGARTTGWAIDPRFMTDVDSAHDQKATRFQLSQNSPLIDKAINIQSELKLRPATKDLIGTSLPQGAAYDLGAFERPLPRQKFVLQ